MEKELTAPQLAAICNVDPKTIRSWAEQGQFPHHYTAGGHLRIRTSDAARFLRTRKYEVPPELQELDRGVLVIGSVWARLAVEAAAVEARHRHTVDPLAGLVMAGLSPADVYVVEQEVVTAAGAGEASYLRALALVGSGRVVYLAEKALITPGQTLPITLTMPRDEAGLRASLADLSTRKDETTEHP